MTPMEELLQSARQSSHKDLEKVDSWHDFAVARAVLAEVSRRIDAVEEGQIDIPLMGRFIVRKVTVEKDGQSVTLRHVFFRSAMTPTAGKAASEVATGAAEAKADAVPVDFQATSNVIEDDSTSPKKMWFKLKKRK